MVYELNNFKERKDIVNYSKLVIKALEYAAFHHKDEVRKGTDIP